MYHPVTIKTTNNSWKDAISRHQAVGECSNSCYSLLYQLRPWAKRSGTAVTSAGLTIWAEHILHPKSWTPVVSSTATQDTRNATVAPILIFQPCTARMSQAWNTIWTGCVQVSVKTRRSPKPTSAARARDTRNPMESVSPSPWRRPILSWGA